MSEATVSPEVSGDVLYRTEGGGRLHIPGCPHVGGALREADAAERLAMPVCSWCRAEIDGTSASDRVGDTCPIHHMTMSVTGACELCE